MILWSRNRPRIGIVGPGRSGKDDAGTLLVTEFGFRSGGTSVGISREVARREGITFEEAHPRRHAERDYWARVGDEMTAVNPASLVEGILEGGNDAVIGIRRRREMVAVLETGLLDIVYWIDRPGIPADTTQEFGPELSHVVVPNHWGAKEHLERWRAIGRTLRGIY